MKYDTGGSSSIFRIGSALGLGVMLAVGMLWWNLPLSIKRHGDIARGKELSYRLENYRRQHTALPSADDWVTLKHIGFTSDEIERAYPQYVKLDNSTYQLIFVKSFDGPYLMWNSSERKWKVTF